MSLIGTHAGLTDEGRSLFDKMKVGYGVSPTIEHYACLVDLLGRAGRIKESLDEFELERNNPGNYMMLSNIYENAGMWEGVKRVRELVKYRGIKGEAGCSWIQIKNKVHTFVAGGGFEFRNSAEFKNVWKELMDAMEEVGYILETSAVLHDVNEETKVMWVCGYSERVALTFALAHTAAGIPIKIIKNLRICADCHS
ncbi:unnamed protein product [Malus baccata var. baccata]